jgi:hypothetical protein
MNVARLLLCLLCLFAAVALALPPLAVRASGPAPADMAPADMECPHHTPAPDHGGQKQSDAKSTVQSCCPSAPFGWAVMAAGASAPPVAAVDRSPRASFALYGFISAKDPPPPRV